MSEHSTIIALSEPPPGESSNFVDPPSLVFLFSIICFVLLGISAICVGLRLYTRKVILGAIGADDYILILAVGCCIGSTITSQLQTAYGLGKHAWDVPVKSASLYLPLFTAATSAYVMGMMCTKLSLLLLYRRVFGTGQRQFNILWWITVSLVVLYSIPSLGFIIFGCIPMQAAWDFVLLRTGHCIDIPRLFIAHGIINAFTDILVFLLPIPTIRLVSVKVERRLLVSILLAIGSLTCAVSIYRVVRLMLQQHELSGVNDWTWDAMTATITSLVELNCGIICVSVITLRPLLRKRPQRRSSSAQELTAALSGWPTAFNSESRNNLAEMQNIRYESWGPLAPHRSFLPVPVPIPDPGRLAYRERDLEIQTTPQVDLLSLPEIPQEQLVIVIGLQIDDHENGRNNQQLASSQR